MYKVTIEHLQSVRNTLLASNKLLKMITEKESTNEFDEVIDENEKQIKMLKQILKGNE